jgi:peptidoglycan hydrolase-like protein with peptidoglycan-binding domain
MCLVPFTALCLVFPVSALALTAEEINAAAYAGGDLPEDQSALTAKLQVLLDRVGVSPGVIDGFKGGMSESALRAFEEREGLPVDGVLDEQVWAALGGPSPGAVLQEYTIAAEDLAQVAGEDLPEDYSELAELDLLATSRTPRPWLRSSTWTWTS